MALRRVLLIVAWLGIAPSLALFLCNIAPKQVDVMPKTRTSWHDRVHQLKEYKDQHGDTLVPKRYAENPQLGNWVNKQRQQYRKYVQNEMPCSLTEEKVQLLDDIGFCWDGTVKIVHQQEQLWWEKYNQVRDHGSSFEKLPASLTSWVRQQRKEFQNFKAGRPSKLDKEKISALNKIDSDWWKRTRERQWDARFRELKAYRAEFGDCCVPISHENRQLAHWVSNLRKKYNMKKAGENVSLSNDQVDQLNAIGFVWNRWDYEFEQRSKT